MYGNSQLPVREREAARWTIALINHCLVCQDTRAKAAEPNHIDEGFYAEVASWATTDALTEREQLAAEFAQRFALDHQGMDDALLGRACAAPSPTTRSPTSSSAAGCSSGSAARWRWSGARARGAHPRLTDRDPGGTMWLQHDLIIRGGTVVDGTGAPARTADVAIADGIITEVGEVDGTATRELDADGLARHARLRRHPHPLRRPGHVGRRG